MEPNPSHPNINRALHLISQASSILAAASPDATGTATSPSTQSGTSRAARTSVNLFPAVQTTSTSLQSTSAASSLQHPGYQPSSRPLDVQQTPDRTSSVIAELRRNFEPYRRPITRGGRNAGRPATSTRPAAPWSHRFCCLGGSIDNITPSRERQAFLESVGLGNDHIFADRNSTKEDLVEKLEGAFPKLRGIPFEMFQAIGVGGGTGKSLRRLSSQHAVLSVPMILQSRIFSIIYLKPESNIVQAEEEPDSYEDPDLHENSIEAEIRAYPTSNEGQQSEIPAPVAAQTRPSNHTSENYPGFVTMLDLRNSLYAEHPGEQLVAVQRDDFVSQVLSVYKNSSFEILKKPMVVFIGEAGRDVGALTKEYFSKGMAELASGRICNLPLFEGEADHRLPTCDGVLLRSGKFKDIGKFICHSALHTGIGIMGMSWAVVEYLCAKEVCSDTILPIEISDIPDMEIRQKIDIIQSWLTSGNTPESRLVQEITDAALETGFHLNVNLSNLGNLREHIMYYHVIEKRKAQLDSIKEGFKGAPLLDFLQERSYLVASVFPRTISANIPVQCILEKLEIVGDSDNGEISRFMTEFIATTCEGGRALELLSCWTGWPLLPEGNLKIKVEDNCAFMIRSCFSEIEVPRGISVPELQHLMTIAINFASSGFGSV